LLKSTILQTGGSAFGEISTKSNSKSSAIRRASDKEYTPVCMFSPTNLICCARIWWLRLYLAAISSDKLDFLRL